MGPDCRAERRDLLPAHARWSARVDPRTDGVVKAFREKGSAPMDGYISYLGIW